MNAEPDKISLSAFNVKKTPLRVQTTFFGKYRAFNTFSALEWVYMVISIAALTASAGLTIERICIVPNYTDDFTFAVLLLITIAFCFYYVVHSVLSERGDELLVFVLTTGIVAIYCILNYIIQERTLIKLVRLIVVCVLSPFLICVGIVQSIKYFRSNRLLFNAVGGFEPIQDGCVLYFWCSSLLKFDLQLQLNMVVLVMAPHGNLMDLIQVVILASGVIITVATIIIGFCGLRKENKVMMTVFYILELLEPIYVIYKFDRVIRFETIKNATYESTFACGAAALAVWISLNACTGCYMTHYFGKGLKENFHGLKTEHPTEQPNPPPDEVNQV